MKNQQGPTGTGNSAQYCNNLNGKREKEQIHVCMYVCIQIDRYRYISESLCCTPETNTTC